MKIHVDSEHQTPELIYYGLLSFTAVIVQTTLKRIINTSKYTYVFVRRACTVILYNINPCANIIYYIVYNIILNVWRAELYVYTIVNLTYRNSLPPDTLNSGFWSNRFSVKNPPFFVLRRVLTALDVRKTDSVYASFPHVNNGKTIRSNAKPFRVSSS